MMLDEAGWTALRLSLLVGVTATMLALPVAIWIAWLLARRDFWGKSVLNALVHLPLVLPPVVTGYLLLLSFGRNGPAGRFLEDTFGLVLAFRWTGAALAAMVMGFPLMLRAIRLAIEAVDPKIEDAARHPWRAWVGCVRLDHLALDPARCTGGRCHGFCQGDG